MKKSIEAYAFENCISLSKVNYVSNKENIDIASNAFRLSLIEATEFEEKADENGLYIETEHPYVGE